jgi:hypothetical protein
MKGVVDLSHGEINYALLLRWKQTLAAMMHTVYSQNAFALLDSRTVNIERALNDLDSLLRSYAKSPPPTHSISDGNQDIVPRKPHILATRA